MTSMRNTDWHKWKMELIAHGEYVEVSFENVDLKTQADVEHWARELTLALRHYEQHVDLLLDLRGLHVGARCGHLFSVRRAEIMRRYAGCCTYFGADEWTRAALEAGDGLDEREQVHVEPGREPALARLMELRRWRLDRKARANERRRRARQGEIPRYRSWEESGALVG